MILLPVKNDFTYNSKGIEIVAEDLQSENKYGVIVKVTTPYFAYGYHCNTVGSPEEIITKVVLDASNSVFSYDAIYSRMLLDSL